MVSDILHGEKGVSEENRYWFKKIVQKSNENNILVMFSKAPLLKSILDDPRIEIYLKDQNMRLNQMCDGYSNVKIISLTNIPLNESETNGDKDHVNEKGRYRISELYSNYIKNDKQY